MNLFFWRKNKKQPNDEALDFLTMPVAEEVKSRKKQKLDGVNPPDVPFSEQEKMAEIEDKYLQFQPKGKKGRRKKIFQIAFLIIVCALSIVAIATIDFGGGGTISFSTLMGNASGKGGWIFLAFFSFVLLLVIDAFRFSYILKLNTGRFRPAVNAKLAIMGKYYDYITPLQTGSQPFQMYYLAKKEIPAGVASAIPLIRYFVVMIAVFIFSVGLVVFNSIALTRLGLAPGVEKSVHVMAYVGIFFNIAIPALILVISLWPKFGKKIISGILKLLKKIRIVRNYQKSYYKTLKTLNEYRNTLKLMLKKKVHMLVLVIVSFGECLLAGTIPYFICVGFGNTPQTAENWFTVMTLYAFVSNSIAILPTPGNAGGAEVSFMAIFAKFSPGNEFWLTLIWRIVTYYSYIVVGIVMVITDFFRNLFKEKFIQRNKLTTTKEMVISGLNSWDAAQRQATLTILKNIEKSDRWFAPKPREKDIKLFLKTNYSSGPYSPTALAYKCYESGSKIIGICDSETLAGAKEFYEACRTLGMGCSIGVQVKADLIKPKLNRRINNMYQADIANLAIIGIPYEKIDYVNNFLAKRRAYRSDRVERIADLISKQYRKIGVSIDFRKDVLPISNEKDGGTVTEMHVILALCNQLVLRYGKGQNLIDILRTQMNVTVPEKSRKLLITSSDENSFVYDLQSVLRNEIKKFYVEADKECCSISDLRKIAEDCQAILTYEYMGDIEQTVFGEIRTETYEDDILDYLLKELKKLGVTAVTVSPSRHTFEQVERVKNLAKELDLLVIVNETIYTRRQEIKGEEIAKEQNQQLIENAFAVCGNERAVSNQIGGFFSGSAVLKYPDINVRAAVFSELGKSLS